MPSDLGARLDRFARDLPRAHPGPGGAVAVLRGGDVLLRHAWGYANAERRIPFTPRTLFRMCSVTKQFTCAAMLDHAPDPAVLHPAIRAALPRLDGALPGALHLAHNQSGLRDYWAVAMLHGAAANAPFGDAEAARVIGGTRSLHFAPGTRYAYCNQNFRLLSDALEAWTGRPFAELLRGVFDRAGMPTAFLAADTRAMPDGTEGYEGSQATGFRPADNALLWTGDAGLGASLDDMIAWERHLDATRDDPHGALARLSAPVAFADGAPAPYGFGLGRGTEFGRAVTGHGGALRGWRSHRLHVAAERVSVVVLFNHMADAAAAALDALAAVLGEARPRPDPALPPPDWTGAYLDPETALAVRIEAAGPGRVRLRHGQGPEVLALQPDGSAGHGRTVLRAAGDGIRMDRPQENRSARLQRCAEGAPPSIAGHWHCDELEAGITVTEAGGIPYAAAAGFLGQGRMEMLEPLGAEAWLMPCHRALDVAPPGDWTLRPRRDAAGRVVGLTVGCWLARGLEYRRVGG